MLCVWRIFLVLPGGGSDAIPPPVHAGVAAVVQDSSYKYALMHCRKSSLPRDAVDKALKTMEAEAPWASHEEWCLALAALRTIHSAVMQRSLGKYKTKLRRVGARGDACTLQLVCQQRSPAIFPPEAYAS